MIALLLMDPLVIVTNVCIFLIHADINECSTNNGGCNQNCTNTIGSFVCSCNTGYELRSSQLTCVGKKEQHLEYQVSVNNNFLLFTDINECTNNNGGCNQTCTNTAGSYLCSCNTGYTLNTDDHACDGVFDYFEQSRIYETFIYLWHT